MIERGEDAERFGVEVDPAQKILDGALHARTVPLPLNGEHDRQPGGKGTVMGVHDVISVGLGVLGTVTPLATLWLRQRFRLQRERERCDYLRVATRLPAGSWVQEQRDDGTRLTVEVGTTTRDES